MTIHTSTFRDKKLLMARALLDKADWTNPKNIIAVRHMAHDGCSVEQIRAAIWPGITDQSARYRLKKLNINVRSRDRAHFGEETSIGGHNDNVDMRSFVARVRAHS